MDNYLFSVFPLENFIDLALYQSGWEQCFPAHTFGPVAKDHYLFHYVISGTGVFSAQNAKGSSTEYHIKSGEGFMMFPQQVCSYSVSYTHLDVYKRQYPFPDLRRTGNCTSSR